jgi:uncharacterized RDD family membrane protein YckC
MENSESLKTNAEFHTDATTSLRLTNFVIDFMATYLLAKLIGFVMGVLGLDEAFHIFRNYTILGKYAFGFIIMFPYYFILETFYGRTLGKLITRTKVVNRDGSQPVYTNIAGRTLARFIPFEPLSFLGTKGWHDSMSDTRVVMV